MSINNTLSYVKGTKPLTEALKIARIAIKNFEENEYIAAVYDLILLKNYIISKIQPQNLNINFIDFLDDDNMWKELIRIEKKKLLNSFDKKCIEYAFWDLIDKNNKNEIIKF